MEKPHKKLKIWQKAIEVCKEIYRITEKFQQTERFGLVSQMRRASVSIASNIAEGSARQSNKEKVQFYYMARGSLSELDTQIEISDQVGLLNIGDRDKVFSILNEAGRLLNGLIQSRQERNEN